MKYAGYYAPGVAKLPQFRGKKIWITGSLNLSDTPTKSLDGIYYIEGNLNVSRTEVSNIDHINVKGHVSDYLSPLEVRRKLKIKKEKQAIAQSRREDDDWNLENTDDDEAIAANAVFEYFIDHEQVDEKTPEDVERLKELKNILSNLEEKESEISKNGGDTTDVDNDIQEIEAEIEELEEKFDIYNLMPLNYTHYGMPMFEVVSDNEYDGQEYCAGTPQEMEDAAKEYAKEQAEENLNNFNKNFVESHIDEDQVVEYFRDFYEQDVRDSPESYFDDDDYELSEEQENRIEEIDALIDVLNNRLEELEDEIEEPSEYRKAYEEIELKIETLESEKEDIEEEKQELTDDMVDDKVEDLLSNVRRDPLRALNDFGIDDLERFVNIDELVNDMIDQDGVGIINSYDGDYHVVYVQGVEYYVMRLN